MVTREMQDDYLYDIYIGLNYEIQSPELSHVQARRIHYCNDLDRIRPIIYGMDKEGLKAFKHLKFEDQEKFKTTSNIKHPIQSYPNL